MVNTEELKEKAKKLRKDTLDLAIKTKDGHIAPCFSTIEILISLYEHILKPQDKFILSKGHACLSFYISLRNKGYNPKISGHPDIEPDQGIECTTGSLGNGLPIGLGMAFAKKFKKEEGNIYVLIGDGECQEGTIWETLNIARKFKLTNLITIVDHNKLQALTSVKEILDETNLKAKFESFGTHVIEIDGHNFEELLDALTQTTDKPKVILAHTTKGKGLSFMENKPEWHSRLPENEQLDQSYKELE